MSKKDSTAVTKKSSSDEEVFKALEKEVERLNKKLGTDYEELNTILEISKAAEQALNESERRYHAFISNSSEGIWRVELEKPLPTKLSADAQIEHMYKYAYLAEANDSMAKMYGAKNGDALVGTRLNDLLVETDPANTHHLTAFIKSGYHLSGVESHELDQAGNDKYFRNSLIGVIENDMLYRAWGTQQDITVQHTAIQELERSQNRLNLAMQVSRMGVWEWNIETNELTWPPEMKALFGFAPEEEITYEKYQSMLDPADSEVMKNTLQEAIKSGKSYQIDHRILWPDGTSHWLQGQGQAFYEGKKPVRMIGTARNIDKQIIAEEALRESEQRYKMIADQQEALVELNEAKDEFITLASHQLRTPATGVKQFIGMLLENYFGDLTEDQRTMMEYAYESNERQLEVINDLLKVAQVDAGKVVLAKEKTDIADLLEDILQEQRSQFSRRKQQVLLDRPSEPVFANVDKSRIRMVVENLTDNASKYTPEGKKILVSVDTSDDGKCVSVKVKDEGVGIAKEDVAKLFKKFSRLDNPLSIQVGGTGIGLYWAKKIVDLHGGTILLKSRLEKGTTFTVKIPS